MTGGRKGALASAVQHQTCHVVVFGEGDEGEDGGAARGGRGLGADAGAEVHARAAVDDEIDLTLAFFAECLAHRPAAASGGAPIEIPHIIARLVDAAVVQLHAATTERRLRRALPAAHLWPARRAAAGRGGPGRRGGGGGAGRRAGGGQA